MPPMRHRGNAASQIQRNGRGSRRARIIPAVPPNIAPARSSRIKSISIPPAFRRGWKHSFGGWSLSRAAHGPNDKAPAKRMCVLPGAASSPRKGGQARLSPSLSQRHWSDLNRRPQQSVSSKRRSQRLKPSGVRRDGSNATVSEPSKQLRPDRNEQRYHKP